ncbi:MAG: NnrS family protein [Deltaproteobacteria bacterium]|nr:NnrS family protein [Deltaproteobacteria bacterium]
MRIERYLQPPAPAPASAGPEPLARRLAAAPWLALGFRPFFLTAALMGALWLPLWLIIYLHGVPLPLAADPIAWHAHELVFGLAAAVLAGFLLTAARNWIRGQPGSTRPSANGTKSPTPSGLPLLGLLGLWVAGRVVLLIGDVLPPALVLLVDVAFLPTLSVALARPLLRAKNRRNYAFPMLLLVLAGLNLVFHLGDYALRRQAITASIDLVAVILVLMGGRVIPFFTKNALPGAKVRMPASLAWTATILTATTLLAPLLPNPLGPVIFIGAGVANLVRLAAWSPWSTLGTPLLWVLHLGYAWIGVAQLLRGLGHWVLALAGTAPMHALTVGALCGLILGMMARVSLGHTGRPLIAPRAMTVAFTLVFVAALARAILPLAAPSLMTASLLVSGSALAVAFALFVVVYWPILTRPRADGAPG